MSDSVELSFSDIERRAQEFAAQIGARYERVINTLLAYESYEVATDEIRRTLDLMTHLSENQKYFRRRIRSVASFLPRNQPLYALSCFAIVPSFMATEVFVRPPLVMRDVLSALLTVLDVQTSFENIFVSFEERQAFVKSRASSGVDVVIFTGTTRNADSIRKVFPSTTLFIANGSGHNPIIVSNTADVEKAVGSALRIQLYNSGQDCANANSILVHTKCYREFISVLRENVAKVPVGPYRERHNRVGPLTDRNELKSVQKLLTDNAEWLDNSTEGVIRIGPAIVEPTILLKPLQHGGNYTEHFAPVFMVQEYADDTALGAYFDDPRYEPHAMYISLFGHSPYVEGLIGRQFVSGKVLHDDSTIVRDTDLHADGVERGTQPYGGYGRGASSVSLNGHVVPMPTCPQRDIYNFLVAPVLQQHALA